MQAVFHALAFGLQLTVLLAQTLIFYILVSEIFVVKKALYTRAWRQPKTFNSSFPLLPTFALVFEIATRMLPACYPRAGAMEEFRGVFWWIPARVNARLLWVPAPAASVPSPAPAEWRPAACEPRRSTGSSSWLPNCTAWAWW